MKKKLALVLALVMAFSMLFALTACTKTPEEQLAEAFKKLENDNAKMVMAVSVSGFSMEILIEIDGNAMKIVAMEETTYVEIDEETGKVYAYVPGLDGSYSKEEGSLEDIIGIGFGSEDGETDALLKAENYTYSEETGIFTLNEDVLAELTESGISEVTVQLNEDGSFVLNLPMKIEGMSATVSVTFSNFGEIELTLPTVA